MCGIIFTSLLALVVNECIHSQQFLVDGGLCKKYSGLTGTVKSPQQRGQSTGYPPNLHCDYRIKTPQGYKIHARFNNFTLKWSPGCVSDYVKLSHDKKKWSQPYCGDRIKKKFETCGNRLFLRFVSDGAGNAEGYHMTFTAVDIDECSPSVPRACRKSLKKSMCEQICINTPGSYRCACRNGFQLALNGKSCELISQTQSSPRMKVGRCPSIKSGKTHTSCTAYDDSSCSGMMKCCQSKSGYKCKEPIFDFLSPYQLSTALSNNFFSLTKETKVTGRVSTCQPTCLTILLDRSGSIGYSNFQSILNFLAALLSNMCSWTPCLSTMAISYASDVRVEFECGQYSCGSQLYEAVKNVKYRSGFTFLDLALQSARWRMVGSSNKNCGRSADCQQIVFILTDGKSNGDHDPVGLARQLERDTGAKIFTFGVTENVNGSELSAVASQELEVIDGTVVNKNVFMSKTFSALDDLAKIINKSHDTHPCSDHLRGSCDHNCIPQGDQFACSCRQGYRLGNDKKSCNDINECLQGNGRCQHRCINTIGSFRCECPDGFSTQPGGRCAKQCQITDRPGDCRIRKDFYSMSSQQRQRFIRVFKLVTTQPPYKSLYDNLIAIHEREFDNGIHSPRQFLSWHRWFVVAVENLLRCADPTITIPYWDYSYTCRSPWDPDVCLDNLWGDNVRSIGGNGTGRFHRVVTGPFAYPGWRLTPSAETDALRRSFRDRDLPCLPAIQQFLALPCDSGTIEDVDVALAGPLHSPIHSGINGTMWSRSSANTPEFYLLHSFIDKLWKDWQKKGSRCRDQTTASPDFILTATGGVKIRHVQDMDRMSINGTTVCVRYEEPSHCLANMVLGRLAGSGKNLQSVTSLPSLHPSYMTMEEAEFTGRSRAEIKKMLDMDRRLQQQGPGGRSSSSWTWSKVDKLLGFKLSALS